MSYEFSSSSFVGDFGAGNEKDAPAFIAAYIKYADHPQSTDYAIAFSESTSTLNGSLNLGINSTEDRHFGSAISPAGSVTSVTSPTPTAGAYDGQWTPIVVTIPSGSGSILTRVDTYANSGTGAYTHTAMSLRYLTLGRAATGAAGLISGTQLAEVVVGWFTPTQADIESYMSGTAATDIWSGRSDFVYYPLDAESSTQADGSGNGGPTLSASGTVTYNSDHPIAAVTNYVPVVQPLYYGATLLANKTNIEWVMTEGHVGINGAELGSGTAATTDASGNVQIPAGAYGNASDPVTLSLYWEEGSAPVVDRSLIVKTTLVAAT